MDLIFARFIQPLAATRFKCRFRLGVLFTTLLISPSSSYSQSTVCASVQPIPGAVGYQSRSGDVRCEGFYQSPVAATALELLSLTLGPIEYQLKDNSFVYVLAPEAQRAGLKQIYVRARAIPIGTYYRMDAIFPSTGTMKWPMASVLAPAGLTSQSVGVVGWVQSSEDNTFVPVSVSDDPAARSPKNQLVAILRASTDLEEVRWRIWSDGKRDQPREWTYLPAQTYRAGEPIVAVMAPSSGLRNAEFAAKAINSDNWLTLRFRMLEP